MRDMDELLDIAYDMKAILRWHENTAGKKVVTLVLPDKKVECIGDSYDHAAWHVLCTEFPLPEDLPEAA